MDSEDRYEIRMRTARGLRDLEQVSRTLESEDFGRTVNEWIKLDDTRSPVERLPDIFSLLWAGLNLKLHVGQDVDYQNRERWVKRRIEDEELDIDRKEIGDKDIQPGYSAVDWENWLERAIRSSEPLAHVSVSIDTYTDEKLDELKREYRDGKGVKPGEFTALFRSGRIPLDEYNELGGPEAIPRITEPKNRDN